MLSITVVGGEGRKKDKWSKHRSETIQARREILGDSTREGMWST